MSSNDAFKQTSASATDESAAKRPVSGAVNLGGGWASVASPHASKFRVATTALFLIALAAMVVAAAVARNSGNGGPALPWSSWTPPDSGTQGARDIADHLAPLYRANGTDQLDAITVLNVASPSSSGSGSTTNQLQVAINQAGSSSSGASSGSGSSVQLIGGKTVVFNLCGLGSGDCSIGQDTPSSNRLLLLRREGLELALYTLKYIKGVQNVVAILPPGTTQATSTLSPTPPPVAGQSTPTQMHLGLLFDQQELRPFLAQPLAGMLAALPPSVAQLPQWRQTPEASLVDQLTARGLFSNKFVNSPEGSYLLVLSPLPPQ